MRGFSDRDLNFSIGFGQAYGYSRVSALGNNPDIDSVPEDVWTGGGNYPWMTGATSLEILSSDANDNAAGTGARTVTINLLTVDFAPVTVVAVMNGITPVALPGQFYRINSGVVASSGSFGANIGTLTIRDAGGGATRGIIQAGYGVTRQSQFTAPAGFTVQVLSILTCINRPTSVRDATIATCFIDQSGNFRLPLEFTVNGNPYRHESLPGLVIAEKTDFGLRCMSVSATNTDVTAAWHGIMKQNTFT